MDFKIGDVVKLKSNGTSVSCELIDTNKKHYGSKPGEIIIIKGITFKNGSANKNDPRYYGDTFNVRGQDLELIKRNLKSYEIY